MKVAVLAGGKGSRLRPLSQKGHPKPLLSFDGKRSLLQKTLLRFAGIASQGEMLVITGEDAFEAVRRQCDELPSGDKIAVIAEKIGKSTAPAVALAFSFFQEKKGLAPSEPVLIVPSDALISPPDNFFEAVLAGEKRAEEGFIVLFGVIPDREETSYGYISAKEVNGIFFDDVHFIEKPDADKARRLIFEKKVLWNTGHLLLTAKTFWGEAALYRKEIANLQGLSTEECNERLPFLESISVDYALLEKSRKVTAVCADVVWSDLGTWDRIYEAFEKDSCKNVLIGNVVSDSSSGCFVLGGGKKIAVLGLQDVIVVETEDTIFIADRQESARVADLLPEESERSLV